MIYLQMLLYSLPNSSQSFRRNRIGSILPPVFWSRSFEAHPWNTTMIHPNITGSCHALVSEPRMAPTLLYWYVQFSMKFKETCHLSLAPRSFPCLWALPSSIYSKHPNLIWKELSPKVLLLFYLASALIRSLTCLRGLVLAPVSTSQLFFRGRINVLNFSYMSHDTKHMGSSKNIHWLIYLGFNVETQWYFLRSTWFRASLWETLQGGEGVIGKSRRGMMTRLDRAIVPRRGGTRPSFKSWCHHLLCYETVGILYYLCRHQVSYLIR